MGIPVEWFVQSPVDEEYMCPICIEVMESPTMIECCEHIFCQACIQECKTSMGKCPLDRESIGGLRPPHRTFVNAYNRLQLKCKHADFGCTYKGSVNTVKEHHNVCEYSNPDLVKPCAKNCGAEIKMRELETHDCVVYLKNQLTQKSIECELMKDEIAELYTKVLALESIKANRASKQEAMLDEVMRLEEALAKLKVEIVLQNDADSAHLRRESGAEPDDPIVEFPEDSTFEDLDLTAMKTAFNMFTESENVREVAPSTAAKIKARRRLMKSSTTSPTITSMHTSSVQPQPIGAAAACSPPGVGAGTWNPMFYQQPSPAQVQAAVSHLMGATGAPPPPSAPPAPAGLGGFPWPYPNQ